MERGKRGVHTRKEGKKAHTQGGREAGIQVVREKRVHTSR